MELIEPMLVRDVFISGVGRVERLADGNLRVVCYTERTCDGQVERIVTARIIISVRATPAAVMTVVRGAGMPCRCQAMRLN